MVMSKLKGRLFIHATNIHHGGGGTLLRAILNAADRRRSIIVSIDARMPISQDIAPSITIKKVPATILHRLTTEWWMARSVGNSDVVLCFGNLPPLFPLRGKTILFLQNRFLIDRVSLAGFNLKTRLRITIERWWFAIRASAVDLFVVQTPSMRATLERHMGSGIAEKIRVIPFVAIESPNCDVREKVRANNSVYDFIYVASGEPHKNHKQLIEAWCLLAKERLRPNLCITVDRKNHAALCRWMDAKTAEHNLKLTNVGTVPHAQVLDLFHQSSAMIYPSTFESFGLPLIEARQAGLPILAAERDYVRDILDPEESFDPGSASSIVRAVKRFMGIRSELLQIVDSETFLKNILENDC